MALAGGSGGDGTAANAVRVCIVDLEGRTGRAEPASLRTRGAATPWATTL